MFRFASLAIGLLTVVMIAPSSQATIFQNRPTLPSANGSLHAQKIAPMKKSAILGTTVIKKTPVKAPSDRKIELSPEIKESQRIKGCQRELNQTQRVGANERPVGFPDNSKTSNNFNSFHNPVNSTYTGDCSFSKEF
jgi:hypothetical protein